MPFRLGPTAHPRRFLYIPGDSRGTSRQVCSNRGQRSLGMGKDVLDYCPIDFDKILQVFDGEIRKRKEQVEQEQDVDRINE